jgi:hypothetical protein
MAQSNYPEAENGLKIYQRLVSENALARQKTAALIIADAMLGTGESSAGEAVISEERVTRGDVLCLRGKVVAPGPDGPSPLPFCYLRRDSEFPTLFFAPPAGNTRLKEIFSAGGDPAALAAALESEPGFSRVTFDDFSWEEKTLYAWILADAARHSHAGSIFKILDDYLYLLARLPSKTSSSWAPLRSQAAAYARQAAEIVFTRALRSAGPPEIEKLSALASRLKEAGLESGFAPDPEESAALAARTAGAALAAPSAENLLPLLHLLKAARDLGAPDLLFHLQNYLMDIFAAVQKAELTPEAAQRVRELYSLSGIIVERFNSRLEKLTSKE